MANTADAERVLSALAHTEDAPDDSGACAEADGLLCLWTGCDLRTFEALLDPKHVRDVTETTKLLPPGKTWWPLKVSVATAEDLRADCEVRYGRHDTPFGPCDIAVVDDAICHLEFVKPLDADLQQGSPWRHRTWRLDEAGTLPLVQQAFAPSGRRSLSLVLSGTDFQVRVWQALMRIPQGALVTYGAIATELGSGPRAVGNAVKANPISYLVPCHRVVRTGGDLGHYGGGDRRKRAMIGWELAQAGQAKRR